MLIEYPVLTSYTPMDELLPLNTSEIDLVFSVAMDASTISNIGLNSEVLGDMSFTIQELSEKSLKNDLQMGIYYLAIKKNFADLEKILLSHYYLRTGNQISVLLADSYETKLEDNIIRNIDSINLATDKNNFQSIESNLCNWCHYWKECDKKTGLNPSRHIK